MYLVNTVTSTPVHRKTGSCSKDSIVTMSTQDEEFFKYDDHQDSFQTSVESSPGLLARKEDFFNMGFYKGPSVVSQSQNQDKNHVADLRRSLILSSSVNSFSSLKNSESFKNLAVTDTKDTLTQKFTISSSPSIKALEEIVNRKTSAKSDIGKSNRISVISEEILDDDFDTPIHSMETLTQFTQDKPVEKIDVIDDAEDNLVDLIDLNSEADVSEVGAAVGVAVIPALTPPQEISYLDQSPVVVQEDSKDNADLAPPPSISNAAASESSSNSQNRSVNASVSDVDTTSFVSMLEEAEQYAQTFGEHPTIKVVQKATVPENKPANQQQQKSYSSVTLLGLSEQPTEKALPTPNPIAKSKSVTDLTSTKKKRMSFKQLFKSKKSEIKGPEPTKDKKKKNVFSLSKKQPKEKGKNASKTTISQPVSATKKDVLPSNIPSKSTIRTTRSASMADVCRVESPNNYRFHNASVHDIASATATPDTINIENFDLHSCSSSPRLHYSPKNTRSILSEEHSIESGLGINIETFEDSFNLGEPESSNYLHGGESIFPKSLDPKEIESIKSLERSRSQRSLNVGSIMSKQSIQNEEDLAEFADFIDFGGDIPIDFDFDINSLNSGEISGSAVVNEEDLKDLMHQDSQPELLQDENDDLVEDSVEKLSISKSRSPKSPVFGGFIPENLDDNDNRPISMSFRGLRGPTCRQSSSKYLIPSNQSHTSLLMTDSVEAVYKQQCNVRFNSRIILYDTYTGLEYDRHPETATCNRLTPMLAQQIKEELNTLKAEMEIHEESRCYTHFF
ncbi:BA75_04768T0 [Komagataella pastoris]|uniref:BA75_04768T0 n=1 Tax=Komagataella pastoris TaxID=4922 RepID=A0A1B2JH66_PICPA|nr:BA75_04768T0 [Komagataella pastoris]